MSAIKTVETDANVYDFIDNISDPQRKSDCLQATKLLTKITWEEPCMRGDSIIGFGKYTYHASKYSAEWMIIWLSPRKSYLSIYIMNEFDKHQELMQKLGTYKTGKCCLNIKKLTDVNLQVLEELVKAGYENMKSKVFN